MNFPEAATIADGLGAGLFLVDKPGRIIHADASGHAMLRERIVLRERDGRLVACKVRAATGEGTLRHRRWRRRGLVRSRSPCR